MSVRQRRPLPHMTAPRPVWFRVLPHPLYKCPFFVIIVPSDDKGKHACQRVFPALFALFALVGASPPASQKAKTSRISIAGRCGQFCRSRNVSRQGKARREYCRIVKGLDAVWAHFCPSKPCLPLLIDGTIDQQVCPCQSMVQGGRSRPSARNVIGQAA